MNCAQSYRIKELNEPFNYNRRLYPDARCFVRSYHEGKACCPDIIVIKRKKSSDQPSHRRS